MGEFDPQSKPDEQHPLLKIDGGDVNHVQPTQTVVNPGWGANCAKRTRCVRWPELVSACWMTLVLCGLSFLLFHAFGMGLYRRQQFITMKHNNSKPASTVFYHHIVPRGSQIPGSLFLEYLTHMTTHYPLLHFNVYFLIDDYYPDAHRSTKRHNLPTFSSKSTNLKLDDNERCAFNDLLARYLNINVIIMPLSDYMANTPLKYKWRLIPHAHLTFYARVFSVWRSGGIGMDFRTFNNDYNNQIISNPRINAILKQHNDGINTIEYAKALNKRDNDENDVFSLFNEMFNDLLYETRSFLNRTISFPLITDEKFPLIRTHRSKRQTNASENKAVNGTTNGDVKNFYNIDNNGLNHLLANYTLQNNKTGEDLNTTTELVKKLANATDVQNSTLDGKRNESDTHKVVLYFSIHSDSLHDPALPTFYMQKPAVSTKVDILSIDMHGTFIAATSTLHPFLTHLITASFGKPPKFAIHEALLTQCSGIFRDIYCDNIYII